MYIRRNIVILVCVFITIVILLAWGIKGIMNAQDIKFLAGIGARADSVISEKSEVLNSEYPPLAALLFYSIYKNPSGWPFYKAWTIYIAIMLLSASLLVEYYFKRWEGTKFLSAFLITTLLLHLDVVITRYDIFVGVALLLMYRSHVNKKYILSGFFGVLAASLKIIPGLAIPIIYLGTPKGKRKKIITGIIAGLIITTSLPIMSLGWGATSSSFFHMLEFHNKRGIQVESTWSGMNMLLNSFQGNKSNLTLHHYAYHNNNLGKEYTIYSQIAISIIILFTSVMAWWDLRKNPQKMVLHLILMFLLVLFVSPILSPTFLVWIIPIILAWLMDSLSSNPKTSGNVIAIATITIAICLLTQWIWPYHYSSFIAQTNLRDTIVLNSRNVLLLLLAILFLVQIISSRSWRQRFFRLHQKHNRNQ